MADAKTASDILLQVPPLRWGHVKWQLAAVRRHSKRFVEMSDQDLRNQSLELRFAARGGHKIASLLAPAFALVQEAASRTIGMRHYDVQLTSGIHLTRQCVVEMATGEGKTLTAILPLYLHALRSKGAQLATANDYLAARDADEMRPVLEFLGMSVGVVQKSSTDDQRRHAYACDVTYGTLGEFGFDFLRDRMKRRFQAQQSDALISERSTPKPETVCRPLHYILVDEADSVMIDDASTPLIIGAFSTNKNEEKNRLYRWAAEIAVDAAENREFRYLQHLKKCELTEVGRRWVRQRAVGSPVADLPTVDLYEFVERATMVDRDYVRDRNYVLADGNVTIVDENTGRLAVGRFWQDGLHQAIQARERVEITAPTSSAARLTVQSLVLSYPLRSGMTGTARSSRREFRKVYKMSVVGVRTRLPTGRKHMPTVFNSTESQKLDAICRSVQRIHTNGRPVLIGSRSVAKSEALSKRFHEAGLVHDVLNARNEANEAAIIADAGRQGRITISTSMAGRGTDIKLTDEIKRVGGLHVILTERNDSVRIDRQLIGRCGRQGDPGSHQLFLSFEDHVLDRKSKTELWASLSKTIPGWPRRWFFQRAQAAIEARNTRNRLAMLHSEKKRLRELRQAGLDPVLDVVG